MMRILDPHCDKRINENQGCRKSPPPPLEYQARKNIKCQKSGEGACLEKQYKKVTNISIQLYFILRNKGLFMLTGRVKFRSLTSSWTRAPWQTCTDSPTTSAVSWQVSMKDPKHDASEGPWVSVKQFVANIVNAPDPDRVLYYPENLNFSPHPFNKN